MERADESLVGQTIAGRYSIEALIGAGAMGSVYRAKQVEIGKRVAIKILRPDMTKDPSAVARFKREAKAASRLDHPCSVQTLDYGEHEGLCFLVMELVEGKSLFQIIKEEAPLAPERCATLVRQVLAALAVAHDLGIVHRDLKPENIIVRTATDDEGNATEMVKVCDFGVAKLGPSHDGQHKDSTEKLTSHGVIVGTPEYMSPEQARAEPLDGRSDIYAMGCILYQMMTRKVPFSADQPVAVLLKHVIEEPVPPSQIVPDVDPRLEAVCLKAMAKSPDDRFKDAREMRLALKGVALRSDAPPDTSSQPRVQLATTPSAVPEAATMELASVSMRTEPIRTLKSQLEVSPPPARRRLTQTALLAVLAGAGIVAVVSYVRSRPATEEQQPAPPPPKTTRAATPPPPSSTVAPVPNASAAPARASTSASSHAPPRASASSPSLLEPLPPAVTSPVATPAPAAALLDASTVAPVESAGKVILGAVRTERANAADVLRALPQQRFTQCYKDALKTKAGLAGTATLVLKVESDGFIPEASFAGPEALADVGKCIAHAVAGKQIPNAQPGSAGAEVDLTFKPD